MVKDSKRLGMAMRRRVYAKIRERNLSEEQAIEKLKEQQKSLIDKGEVKIDWKRDPVKPYPQEHRLHSDVVLREIASCLLPIELDYLKSGRGHLLDSLRRLSKLDLERLEEILVEMGRLKSNV